MATDTSRTAIDRDFAGRRRRFQLRLGEIGELERLCGVGIGAIQLRLAGHTFTNADVRETVRLGLEGGGAKPTEALAVVNRYVDGWPIGDNIGLAMEVLNACVAGVEPPKDPPGKEMAEGADPATSPPSTPLEPPPA